MKSVVVYEVFSGEQLKFSSIDQDEVNAYCQVLYDATGVLATIQSSDYLPTDHTKQDGPYHFVKYGNRS